MAILAQQMLVGNLGSIYDLRSVGKNNTPVIDFTVAVTPRKRDADGEWYDAETYWITVTAWNKLAENIAASFRKGDRVFVHGRIEMKDGYTNKDGEEVAPRPIMIADFAGLEVSYDAAESKRAARTGGASGGSSRPAPAKKAASKPAPAEDDLFGDDDDDFDFDDDTPPF